MDDKKDFRARLDELLSPEARRELRDAPLPERVELMIPEPMLAEDPGPDWVFEPLFDGLRCLALHDGSSVRLLYHGTRPLHAPIPEIERALREGMPAPFALDGQILDVDPEFEQGMLLSGRERATEGSDERKLEPRFVAFDLLHLAGRDLTRAPLEDRRRALRALFSFSETLMYARESIAPARIVFEQAEREGWRGVVAKRRRGRYVPGDEMWREWRREAAQVGEPGDD